MRTAHEQDFGFRRQGPQTPLPWPRGIIGAAQIRNNRLFFASAARSAGPPGAMMTQFGRKSRRSKAGKSVLEQLEPATRPTAQSSIDWIGRKHLQNLRLATCPRQTLLSASVGVVRATGRGTATAAISSMVCRCATCRACTSWRLRPVAAPLPAVRMNPSEASRVTVIPAAGPMTPGEPAPGRRPRCPSAGGFGSLPSASGLERTQHVACNVHRVGLLLLRAGGRVPAGGKGRIDQSRQIRRASSAASRARSAVGRSNRLIGPLGA